MWFHPIGTVANLRWFIHMLIKTIHTSADCIMALLQYLDTFRITKHNNINMTDNNIFLNVCGNNVNVLKYRKRNLRLHQNFIARCCCFIQPRKFAYHLAIQWWDVLTFRSVCISHSVMAHDREKLLPVWIQKTKSWCKKGSSCGLPIAVVHCVQCLKCFCHYCCFTSVQLIVDCRNHLIHLCGIT